MNKKELSNYLSSKYKISKSKGDQYINIFVDVVQDILKSGQSINLTGFGSFEVKKIASKEGRNPRTGKTLIIPEYNRAVFKPGKNLKDFINK